MAETPVPSTDFALPPQPPGVSFPTLGWSTGEQLTGDPDRLADLLDPVFAVSRTPELGESLAFVAVQGGRIVAERYGPGVTAATTLLSWSTAKSMTHAALGLLVADGAVDPDAPVDAPEWSAPGDPRAAITAADLLAMRSGLHFIEDYVDDAVSNCLEMLWGAGADDVAHYAADQPLEHPIDTEFNYSSGTTNILTRLIGDHVQGGEAGMRAFLAERLFGPLGMTSAEPRFDAAGTGLRPFRAVVPARRRLGRTAPAPRGLGGPGPHDPFPGSGGRLVLRPPLVGAGRRRGHVLGQRLRRADDRVRASPRPGRGAVGQDAVRAQGPP
jgi:CubicO group peptidase (beta-lactamase class C family)